LSSIVHYFDTSFLVPLIVTEATTPAVTRYIATLSPADMATSLWTRVEFASLAARDVRSGAIPASEVDNVRAKFDQTLRTFELIAPEARDFAQAYELLKDHRSGLRGGDALHLAIARNRGAETVHSLDKGMIRAGRSFGLRMTGVTEFGDHD
jgi:predicted nucleic acid-binding protein